MRLTSRGMALLVGAMLLLRAGMPKIEEHRPAADPAAGASASKQNNKLLALAKDHPALAVTLIYITLSIIGALYSFILFNEFGINYFDYAESTDFLIAALKRPLGIIIWLLITIGLFYASYRLQKKKPRNKYIILPLILSIMVASFVAISFAIFSAYSVERKCSSIYNLQLARERETPAQGTASESQGAAQQESITQESSQLSIKLLYPEVAIIGKSADYLILYNHEKKSPFVINKLSVRMMTYVRNLPFLECDYSDLDEEILETFWLR